MSIFANYPNGVRENPFDVNANGTYFAYLTNRVCCLSYLSEKLEDFDYMSNNLYNAMPMGYTNLCVFERVFAVNSEGVWKKFNDKKYSNLLFITENNGESKLVSQAELLEKVKCNYRVYNTVEDEVLNICNLLKSANEKMNCDKISAVGAIKLKEYTWH